MPFDLAIFIIFLFNEKTIENIFGQVLENLLCQRFWKKACGLLYYLNGHETKLLTSSILISCFFLIKMLIEYIHSMLEEKKKKISINNQLITHSKNKKASLVLSWSSALLHFHQKFSLRDAGIFIVTLAIYPFH